MDGEDFTRAKARGEGGCVHDRTSTEVQPLSSPLALDDDDDGDNDDDGGDSGGNKTTVAACFE